MPPEEYKSDPLALVTPPMSTEDPLQNSAQRRQNALCDDDQLELHCDIRGPTPPLASF
jgi:hypothetical protein